MANETYRVRAHMHAVCLRTLLVRWGKDAQVRSEVTGDYLKNPSWRAQRRGAPNEYRS